MEIVDLTRAERQGQRALRVPFSHFGPPLRHAAERIRFGWDTT